MSSQRRYLQFGRALLGAASVLLLSGCPLALEDNFEIVDDPDGETGSDFAGDAAVDGQATQLATADAGATPCPAACTKKKPGPGKQACPEACR